MKKKERKPRPRPIERMARIFEDAGFVAEIGEMGDGSGSWLKVYSKKPLSVELPLGGEDDVDGAMSIEFGFDGKGQRLDSIDLSQETWEKTDERTLARIAAPERPSRKPPSPTPQKGKWKNPEWTKPQRFC